MRRIGPCKILAKYGSNTYKVDLPTNVSLSPIFNVLDLIAFKGKPPEEIQSISDVAQSLSNISLPSQSIPQAEQVLDSRILKKIRNHTYMRHLIKWKDKPISKATWIPKADFQKFDISSSLLPQGVT